MVLDPSALSSTSAVLIVTDKCHPEKVALDVAKRTWRDAKSTMKGMETPKTTSVAECAHVGGTSKLHVAH